MESMLCLDVHLPEDSRNLLLLFLSCQTRNPRSHPQSSSVHTPVHERDVQWLEPVETKRILCGGISEDHVRVVEHVQTIKRQWVDFEIVQGEMGVDVKIHICGQ